MASSKSLTQIWQQTLELNIHYYSAVSRLAIDYWKDLLTAITEVQLPSSHSLSESMRAKRPVSGQPSVSVRSVAGEPSVAKQAQSAGVMVLEGEEGDQALGVFLVANSLDSEVSARVHASSFADADGHTVESVFTFDPEIIMLAPGEQLLVRVTTVIGGSLEPEVRYRGEFTVPEIPGTRIPIVLRRRPAADQFPVKTNSTRTESLKKVDTSGPRGANKTRHPTKQRMSPGKNKS